MSDAITNVGGPMFERATSGVWRSVYKRDGGHYNNFGCKDKDGIQGLRDIFPEGNANPLNFVLFSTSGVHGMYTTIEQVEEWIGKPDPDEDIDDGPHRLVTFLIVQTRLCTVRWGNCQPETAEDIAYLKQLRASSWAAVQTIGAPDEDTHADT